MAKVKSDSKALPDGELVATEEEAATFLGVAERSIRRLLGAALTGFRDPISKKFFVSRASLVAYASRQQLGDSVPRDGDPATADVAEQYGDGPRAYTIDEYLAMTGESRDYVRSAVAMGRIPGLVNRSGDILISGIFARMHADELVREKAARDMRDAEAAAGRAAEDERAGGWVTAEEAAKILGVKVGFFRLTPAGVPERGLEFKRGPTGVFVRGAALDHARRKAAEK